MGWTEAAQFGISVIILVSVLIGLKYYDQRNKLLDERNKALQQEIEQAGRFLEYTPKALEIIDKAQKAQTRSNEAIGKHRDALRHGDTIRKLEAISEMGKIGNPLAIEHLKGVMTSEKKGVRWFVYTALAQIGEPEGIDMLIQSGLNDSEPALQAHTAQLLSRYTHAQARDMLISKSKDSEHRCVRMYASRAAMVLGSDLKVDIDPLGEFFAYALIKAPKMDTDTIQKKLQSIKFGKKNGIIESALVAGEYDIIVKVVAEDIDSLNEIVMHRIQGLLEVERTNTFIVINEPRLYYWQRPVSLTYNKNRYITYVLVKVPALYSGGVVVCLMDLPEVVEAAAVYGESDVIVKIETSMQEERDSVIMEKIRRIPFVEFTRTYAVTTCPIESSYLDNSSEFSLRQDYFV